MIYWIYLSGEVQSLLNVTSVSFVYMWLPESFSIVIYWSWQCFDSWWRCCFWFSQNDWTTSQSLRNLLTTLRLWLVVRLSSPVRSCPTSTQICFGSREITRRINLPPEWLRYSKLFRCSEPAMVCARNNMHVPNQLTNADKHFSQTLLTASNAGRIISLSLPWFLIYRFSFLYPSVCVYFTLFLQPLLPF